MTNKLLLGSLTFGAIVVGLLGVLAVLDDDAAESTAEPVFDEINDDPIGI